MERETVDEVMKALNGLDSYFIRIRGEIFKRSGYTDLRWGVENLSTTKLFKLVYKAYRLDKEDAAEKRKRIKYEKKNEHNKKRFLNTIDI